MKEIDTKELQIERIAYMEGLLDESLSLMSDLSVLFSKLELLNKHVQELSTYYKGPLWRKDYQDDEKGMIPRDLKRGVLSEDAIYNLLSDVDELYRELEVNTKAVK